MSRVFTDTDLLAFMDGSLADEALIAGIEAAINADPALAARAEALAAGDERSAAAVRAAFAPLLDAPVPHRLTALVSAPPGGDLVDLAAHRPQHRLPSPANDAGSRSRSRWPQFAAMAASLALGMLIGGPLMTGGGGVGGGAGGGSLVRASADVTTMLDTVPSGQAVELASLGTGEVVLTFRTTDGDLCRQFMIANGADATSDALACRDADGGWQIEAFGRRASAAGEMKLAGGDAAPGVVAAVDAIIASDPLLGADELAELAKR